MKSSTVLLSVLALTVLAGCSKEPETEAPSPPRRIQSGGMPATFSPAALRLDGDPRLVLVEGKHGIQLVLAEYNARVGEVPLPADSDTSQARWQTLDRLVDHKVCAAEGRLRGFVADSPHSVLDEERQLVEQVVREGMLEAQSISDGDARAFFAAHPELFAELSEEDLQTPALLLHVKYTLHNHRWREQVDRWREREEVVVHRDRFEELLAGSLSIDPNPSKQESTP